MKKILIIISIIIILIVSVIINMNIPNKKVLEAFKNIENFSEVAVQKEQANSMLEHELKFYEGLKIDVSKKKIAITENSTNDKHIIFYNLDNTITFYTLTEVNTTTTYDDYLEIIGKNNFMMELCYTAILSLQENDIETNYSYISKELIYKLAGKEDNYLFFNGDQNDFKSYKLSEEDQEKKVIFVPEFEKYAVEYFTNTYKDKFIINDKDGKNTYEMSIEAENITNDSCTIKHEIKIMNKDNSF